MHVFPVTMIFQVLYEKAKTEQNLSITDFKLANVWKDTWYSIKKDIHEKLEHEMQSLLCFCRLIMHLTSNC